LPRVGKPADAIAAADAAASGPRDGGSFHPFQVVAARLGPGIPFEGVSMAFKRDAGTAAARISPPDTET
jgi:hypothetical protein